MASAAPIASSPNPSPSPAPAAPSAAPAAAPWYGDLSSDPDLKGWAELKKLDSPVAALKYGRDTEKFVGVPKDQLVRLPGPDAKPEDWNPVYDRLGRPAKPEDYQIPAVEGGEEFTAAARGKLHEIGLNQRQVTALTQWWNEYMTNGAQKVDAAEAQEQAIAEQERQRTEAADIAALHQEWPGDEYARREEMGRRAFRDFVAPFAGEKAAEFMDKMEGALGTGNFLRFMANIGASIGEAKFAGDTSSSRYQTADAARAELEEKKQDKEWMKKVYQNPKGPEGREWDRLISLSARAKA